MYLDLANLRLDFKTAKFSGLGSLSSNARVCLLIILPIGIQIEGSLLELLKPVYPRTEEEGPTLIQAAMRSVATIEPMDEEFRVTLASLSSPHRSKVIAAVCEELNRTSIKFPGTKLQLRFAVAEPPF
jgi:hypothetical protein